MKSQKILLALALIASATVTGTAQASLVDRGNGLLYDNVLNVTWLRDVHHSDGTFNLINPSSLTWADANAWASGLGTGWRLPSTLDATGWATNSEMLTLSTDGNLTSAYFQGLVTDPAMRPVYWSSTEVSYWGPTVHFYFSPTPPTNSYNNDSILASSNTYALAVHNGDIGAVPVPGAAWLFGSGMLGLLGFKKRRGNIR